MPRKICKVTEHNFQAIKLDEIKTAPKLVGGEFSQSKLRIISQCSKCGILTKEEMPLTVDLTIE